MIDLPHYSQYDDIKDSFWQNKSCGVVCVKMILDFLNKDNLTTIASLIKEGIEIDGYSKEGWLHGSLVILLRNHGVPAYRQEFRSKDEKFQKELEAKGIEKIKKSLEGNNPVIVSVKSDFDDNKDSHLIVLTGYDDESVYYNDPNTKDGNTKKDVKVDFDKFVEYWRPYVIFTA
ncbi:MAG: hypothetical protein ACI9GH_000247 [Candidatus Paceibacteria bacterium]|jgi:uncharacterized protein YvpB